MFQKELQIILMETVLKNVLDFAELTIKKLDQFPKNVGAKLKASRNYLSVVFVDTHYSSRLIFT